MGELQLERRERDQSEKGRKDVEYTAPSLFDKASSNHIIVYVPKITFCVRVCVCVLKEVKPLGRNHRLTETAVPNMRNLL